MGRSVVDVAQSQRGWVRFVVVALLAIVLVIGAYVWLALTWSYSSGDRAGVLQKLSQKGWVCKTWEGELAMTTVPGVAPTIWQFSVRDAATASRLEQSVGHKVVLHYSEHKGIPTSCFGDTPYFVDNVSLVGPEPGTS